MYKCNNAFKSETGVRYEYGESIDANTYYNLSYVERQNFTKKEDSPYSSSSNDSISSTIPSFFHEDSTPVDDSNGSGSFGGFGGGGEGFDGGGASGSFDSSDSGSGGGGD